MKIAQVAPLHESVPPRLYGGTERVVSYQDAKTISFCFRNSPLVSFWSGLAGAPCRRESRLKAAPAARIFAMIGFTQKDGA